MKLFLQNVAFAFFLTSCAINLVTYSTENALDSKLFFEPIALIYGNDTLYLDSNAQSAYNNAIDSLSFSANKCYGKAYINVNVIQNSPNSTWSIGTVFVPFWPISPVDETFNYNINVKIYCDNSLAFAAEYSESEDVKAFWYGQMRAYLANAASNEIHRKLIERLRYDTALKRSVNLDCISDY